MAWNWARPGLTFCVMCSKNFPPAGMRKNCLRQIGARAPKVIDGFVQYHLGLSWEGGYFRTCDRVCTEIFDSVWDGLGRRLLNSRAYASEKGYEQRTAHVFSGCHFNFAELLGQPGLRHRTAFGCECGAGTFNPNTFLRVIGPEPWSVAYVEPSRRPTDGRYGENPNRLQRYFQFQVIMKPSPDNVQDLYLQSLKALGINPRARHPFCGRRLGISHPRRLGALHGKCGSRYGSEPVHLFQQVGG